MSRWRAQRTLIPRDGANRRCRERLTRFASSAGDDASRQASVMVEGRKCGKDDILVIRLDHWSM